MADPNYENSSPRGFSITTETIAQGKIRIKTKIWVDNLELDKGIKQAIDLYDNTLKDFRSKGFKIDGDP